MPDKRTQRVEGFRVTPQEKDFAVKLKGVLSVEKMLKGKGLMLKQAMDQLMADVQNVNVIKQRLMSMAPKRPLHELPGMDFLPEESVEEVE